MPHPSFPDVRIAPSRRLAIAEALRERVLGGVHLGTLEPGARLPSLRTIAEEMHADPRLVHTAYRQLAAEGLVRLSPRCGIFVADSAGQAEALLPQTAGWVVDMFVLALAHGLAPTEFRRQARMCLDSVRVRAACVECNHDQIHALCEEVRRDYGIMAAGLERDDVLRRGAPPRALERADFIVTTRFHARELQERAARLHKPVIVVSLAPAFVAEIRRLVAEGPLYFLCTDPRFAAKLPHIFAGMRPAIRAVVLGRDRLEGIPRDAMVYAMPGARERLPSRWRRHPRVVTAPGVFSASSARDILTAIVLRNLRAVRASRARKAGRSKAATLRGRHDDRADSAKGQLPLGPARSRAG
jgi:DNA-binding transcriptional regulator YhcF (GntR family)